MKRVLLAFFVGVLLTGAGAFYLARPKQGGRVEIDNPIIGPKTETVAVAEVLNGIRGLNRLVVYQAYLTAVTKSKEDVVILSSDQTMITPAFVNYYVDMDRVKLTVDGKIVKVRMPPLMIERPNVDTNAIEFIDKGLWSSVSDSSKRLWKKNANMAVRQLYQRANMKLILSEARKQAVADVLHNTRQIVNRSGGSSYGIVVSF